MMETDIASAAEQLLADARREVADAELGLGLATAELLTGVEEFIGRYVLLPGPAEVAAAALFVLHTWSIEACDATPYLVVVSAEKRSGKTRLLEVLKLLVRHPWHTASTTEAALFRKIEQERPTLLLDEIDAVFGVGGGRTEPLRAVLNAGNRRGSSITRAEGKGTREFSVFCAKVLAGIDTGTLPDTVADRSVVIRMRRRDGEPVERLRARVAEHHAGPIQWSLQQWGAVASPALAQATPLLPDELGDRAADAWEPLLAIADFAGPAWSTRARSAALTLSGVEAAEEPITPQALRESIRVAREEAT